jgi:hypothetical protein
MIITFTMAIYKSIVSWVLPALLCMLAFALVLAQFSEFVGNKEIIPLTSFLVLLTMSNTAFNWCRVSENFTSHSVLVSIYYCAVALLVASLSAVVSAAFAFVTVTFSFLPNWLVVIFTVLHILLFIFSLIVSLVAFIALLRRAAKENTSQGTLRKQSGFSDT